MRTSRSLAVAAAALVVVVAALPADAAPVSKCNAAKKKCIGKYVAAVLGCHAKAEAKGLDVDAECVAKARGKITGGGKGCFDKLDAKAPDCSQTGNATQQLTDADALIADVVGAVDPAFPAPTRTLCGAARKKCAAKLARTLLGCDALANKGADDPECAVAAAEKFAGANGCDPKVLAKADDCLGSTTSVDLGAAVDAWRGLATFTIDYSGPSCGNGVLDAGESCDPGSPDRPEAVCGSEFACVGCTCACPGTIELRADAPATFDLGWSGLGFGTPLSGGTDLTLAVSDCAGTERPCGTCTVGGPIANAGATSLRNRRCSNDTSIRCTDDAPCATGGGTCEFFFGPDLPISAGTVGLCVVNQIVGPVAGTVNLESGELATSLQLTTRVYVGIGFDTPCPRCVGDAAANDDVSGGTCDGGDRDGLECDANGAVAGRPDFGATSLDCPPLSGALIATMPLDLGNATDPVARTVTTDNPSCSGSPGNRCLCDTCNNANAEPCMTNADCPPTSLGAGICGGRRCLGGPNAGEPCIANSQCPGGVCVRPGEPARPNACFDPSECSDTSPVDGIGECLAGPTTSTCSAPHAQRVCNSDDDCTPGTCLTANRACFPNGGPITAYGVEDAPQRDVASPTLASVFCVPPTGASAANNVFGLPGPARMTLKATATSRP